MKQIKSGYIIFLLIILILSGVFWFFQQEVNFLKDGLCLKYETTLPAASNQIKATHVLRFIKKNGNHYQVNIQSDGFLAGNQTYIIDKYFTNERGESLPGPTAAVLWSAPYLLRIGNNLAAGEVIEYANWHGYSVAVVQDPFLANCYGFYERKTGLQVGYINCFTPQKLLTVIKETNIKGF
jgi:hypothetical protein